MIGLFPWLRIFLDWKCSLLDNFHWSFIFLIGKLTRSRHFLQYTRRAFSIYIQGCEIASHSAPSSLSLNSIFQQRIVGVLQRYFDYSDRCVSHFFEAKLFLHWKGESVLCIMDGICYQSFTDSDVCTYMSDRLDINYRIIPHSSLLLNFAQMEFPYRASI